MGLFALGVLTSINCASSIARADDLSRNDALEKEMNCLTKAIYFEARGEQYTGKLAVAQVIVNRTQDHKFPNTVCGVISERTVFKKKTVCQFTWNCKPKIAIRKDTEQYFESFLAAKAVLLDGYRLDQLTHALYFHSSRERPKWNLNKVAHIGHQIFYSRRNV